MFGTRLSTRTFTLIAIVCAIYCILFIYRTSFVVDGERYFSLFDDAMISMRYGKNLASGAGLVWNPGERVEGYTNLLWTLYMALLHLLPISASKISLLVQVSGAALIVVNLLIVRKLAEMVFPGSGFTSFGAVLLAAFYLPLIGWTLQGMEVGLLALIVTLAVYLTIRNTLRGKFSLLPYIVLTTGMFVRPDMGVPYLVILIWAAITDSKMRKRHLIWGLSLLALAVVAQTVFRLLYYGDILPNTYYLKLTGFPLIYRLTRGLYVSFVFIWRMGWIIFLIPFAILMRPRNKPATLLLAVFLGQLGYSIYVGGDAWESWGGSNRYVAIAMPSFFVVFFGALAWLGRLLKDNLIAKKELSYLALPETERRVKVVALVLCFISFNAIYGPAALTELLLLKKTLHVDKNEKMVERALVLTTITDPEARVAVVWDGAIPYFSGRRAISILGKNDRHIARLKMRLPKGPGKVVAFYPGHLKWDYAYSIGRLRPDVVVHLWQAPEEAMPYLVSDYVELPLKGMSFYLRKTSPHILWDRVRQLAS